MMAASNPDWLDVVQHCSRGFRVPFLLVVQHHAVPAVIRLVAPVSRPLPGDLDMLAPRLIIAGNERRARLLDINAVPAAVRGDTVMSASVSRDAILDALDIILYGYPVGVPN